MGSGKKFRSAFTLIELLVVVAIIGILATMIMLNLTGAKARARNAKRLSDLNNIKKAMDSYYADSQSVLKYPKTFETAEYDIDKSFISSDGDRKDEWDNFFSGKYLTPMPKEAMLRQQGGKEIRYYGIYSDGNDYKVFARYPENCSDPAYKTFVDPQRSTGNIDDNGCWAWAYYTEGGKGW